MAALAACEIPPQMPLRGNCPLSAALFRDKLEQRGRVYDATTCPEQVPGCPASVCLIRLPGLLPASAIASPCRDSVLSLKDYSAQDCQIEYRTGHPSFTLTFQIRRRRPQLSHAYAAIDIAPATRPATPAIKTLPYLQSAATTEYLARRRWNTVVGPRHRGAHPAALPVRCRSLCRAVTMLGIFGTRW